MTDEDGDDNIDDDNRSEGTNEDNDNENVKSNVKVKYDDDACSPTKKGKYIPTMVSPAMDKSQGGGDDVCMDKLYQNLSSALGGEHGFDLMDPSVQKSMTGLQSELNDLVCTTYQLYVTELSNNTKISYVKVPRTASNCSS